MLESDRLKLRPWQINDIDGLVEGLNHMEVSKWLASVPFPFTYDLAVDRIQGMIDKQGPVFYEWAIVLKEGNLVIGGIGLSNVDEQQAISNGGGIFINPKYAGHGYGKEAWGVVLSFAFDVLKLRRVANGFFAGNEVSHHMQTSFGAKVEGIARQAYRCLADNQIKDNVLTAILKEDWETYKKQLNK